mmetsp:Transcript_7869/g.17132  ORF Transcript_7869/g.17132 Transcript_7869/m.17132 type:complete len:262 (+) Transcript_7869:175-960(+)
MPYMRKSYIACPYILSAPSFLEPTPLGNPLGNLSAIQSSELSALVAVSDLLLDLRHGLARVESLGTGLGAVHDGVAAVQLERIVQLGEALCGQLVSGVLDPAVRLHEHCRSQVFVGVPPVGGAGRGAAGAQDALVHAVQLLAVLNGLHVLSVVQVVRSLHSRLQPGLDGLVLIVEVGHVGDQVLHYEHVGEGVDLGGLGALVDEAQAGEGVVSVDVHRARAADALSAGSAEGQRGVLLVLNLQKGVQHHGPALGEVYRVGG